MVRNTKFDIALSFAGEDRNYVDKIANLLRQEGISVFYDLFEEAKLWGKDLYEYLTDIYQNQARYTIMFVSQHYASKLWTRQERKAMQARAFQENEEYILPAKFDDTEIPGILPTLGFIDLRKKTPDQFVEVIKAKLIYGGGTIPSENLRKALSTIRPLPKLDPIKTNVKIIDDSQNPISKAHILLMADNSTFLEGWTNEEGIAVFEIRTRRNYTILIAHENFASAIVEKFDPEQDLEITINEIENVGSIICPWGTGHITGLDGRLSPILDSSNRMYFYADNISIDNDKIQPARFKLNDPIQVEDKDGVIMNLIFRFIKGRSTLIDFIKPVYE